MLVFHEASSGRTQVFDGMDAAGGFDVEAYLRRLERDRYYVCSAVCIPGLADGLWLAHQKWEHRNG